MKMSGKKSGRDKFQIWMVIHKSNVAIQQFHVVTKYENSPKIFHVMNCAINSDERQKASWVTHKLVEMNCFLRTASIEWVTNPGADSCSLPLPAISLTQTILQLLIQKLNIFRAMKWSVKYICLIISLAPDVEFVKCFTTARLQKSRCNGVEVQFSKWF